MKIKKVSHQRGKVEGEEYIVAQASSYLTDSDKRYLSKNDFTVYNGILWATKYSPMAINVLAERGFISASDAEEIQHRHLEFVTEGIDLDLPEQMWEHQKKAVKDFLVYKKRVLWGEAGSGKTWIAIETLYQIWKERGVVRGIIIAPNTGIISEWLIELKKRGYPEEFINEFHYDIKATSKQTAERISYAKKGIFLTTYKSLLQEVSTGSKKKLLIDIVKGYTPEVVVFDESHKLKNRSGLTYKKLKSLSSEYMFMLTGTPWDKLVPDIYTQVSMVNKDVFSTYNRFEDKYADREISGKKKQPWGMQTFYKINGLREDRKDEFYTKLFQQTSCIFKDQSMDLPDKLFIEHPYTVPPKIARTINKLKKEKDYEGYVSVLLDSGLVSAKQLTELKMQGDSFRINSLVRNLCSGFLRSPELDINLKIDDSKIKLAASIVDSLVVEQEKKVVIFAETHNEIEDLHEMLEKAGIRHVINTGKTVPKQRIKNKELFLEDKDTMVYLGTTAANKEGLNLQVAHHVIFYSLPNEDSIEFSQAIDRIHRGEQKETCCYHVLFDSLGVEEAIFSSLKEKLDTVDEAKIEKKLREIH